MGRFKNISLAILLYLTCVSCAGLFWRTPLLLTLIYLAASVACLGRWHGKNDLAYYFVPFVMGPAGESIATYLGAWHYAQTEYLLPVWLPFVWGLAGLFMWRAMVAIDEIRGERLPLSPVTGEPLRRPGVRGDAPR